MTGAKVNATKNKKQDEDTDDSTKDEGPTFIERRTRFNREFAALFNQVNTLTNNKVQNKSGEGLAWMSAEAPKHRVSVLLETNMILTDCCTKMGLGQPLPSTETIVDLVEEK